jgi:hypothetical protein
VTNRRRRGAPEKLTPALERKLRKAFDADLGPRKATVPASLTRAVAICG